MIVVSPQTELDVLLDRSSNRAQMTSRMQLDADSRRFPAAAGAALSARRR
jgi:hypothetical protein